MKTLVTYVRPNKEPRQLSARLTPGALKLMDPLMEKLGFERVGKQDELFILGLARCSKCSCLFERRTGGAVLPDEAFCRRCIRRYWGGEK